MPGQWVISKTFRFEAAHHLPMHDGKCARVHGHSWQAVVEVRSLTLHEAGPKSGMVMDFGDISTAVKPLLDAHLDHWDLNVTTSLANPTSEALARWLFERLDGVIPNLCAVTIHETCTSACRYARD